jgi:predicted Zn-dependent protease
MTRLTISLSVALSLALVSIAAAPDNAEAQRYRYRKFTPPKPVKKSRKELAVDRHMYTAQYYLLRENNLKAAAREFQKVLRLDRGHVAAGIGLADLHIRDKKPKRAVAVLRRLARQNKTEAKVQLALGRAHEATGDRAKALSAYRQAVKIAPRDTDALYMVFDALNKALGAGKADKSEVVAAAGAFIVASSGDRAGYRYKLVERALVRVSGDPIDLVIYDANRAYETAFTERRMGRINAQMAEARRGYQRCLNEQPKNQRCHYGLGLVHASVKASDHYDRKAARKHFLAADKLPEAHYELARMARMADDFPSAKKSLTQALSLRSDYQQALLELGIVYKLEGEDAKAINELTRAYYLDRSSAAAEKAVSEIAKLDPENRVVKMGMLYGRMTGDVFSTERFKAAVSLVEEQLGGVDTSAPEAKVLQQIMGRILEAADIDSTLPLKVSVLKTQMINAMAMPNGNLYFTRGFLDYVKKTWPKRPIDADNDVIAHVMGHEVAHVLRQHTLRSVLYRQAVKDSNRSLDPAIITHVTRLQEIEADRVGIVLASLAGYHPRGGIEFMEDRGKAAEIPTHLDHPTYEERVQYLEEYWTNDVKYAYLSFELGLREMERGDAQRAKSAEKAAAHYRKSIDHLQRFKDTLKPTKRVLNNLGVAHAKLGILELTGTESPLFLWQTGLSVEKESKLAYRGVQRESSTRGARARRKADVPRDLATAIKIFESALERDRNYGKAAANLAAVYLAVNDIGKADKILRKVRTGRFEAGELALLRGIVWAERKKYAHAGTAFRTAMRNKGTAQAGRYNMARLYAEANYKRKAKSAYQVYLRKYPRGPWAAAARKAMRGL